ncbi:response regulator transcription factor [Hutsoniella sourekii]|uniref:response regulator transcription factor n=1 Tax=Hutsoniella sourekii TaxID=87650 RepID=UPI000488AC12|nr:response regulator transcription factor [Hutsoniella sourekii]
MKLLILDDHHLFGQSLQRLLEDQAEIEFCDFTSEINQFYTFLDSKDYDLLLIDINLKTELTGFDVVRQLRKEHCELPVVILTAYDLANYRSLAYELGVKDFINKSVEIDELVKRLKAAKLGMSTPQPEKILDPLTPREIELLQGLVQGQSKKDLAKELYISERTLYNHLTNIYSKLDASNLIEAYNKAMELGYINPVM